VPPVDPIKFDKIYRLFDNFDIDDTTFSYRDGNGTMQKVDIYGSYWQFRGMVEREHQEEKIDALLSLLKSKGAVVLDHNKEKNDISLLWDRPKVHKKTYIGITYGWSDNFRVYIHEERYLQ